jgi:NAD(P)-dependent dehydrogenase (short-subunit alcohol dehydrogenase family)
MSSHLHSDPDFTRYVEDRTSSRRWGHPDDLRGLMVFLTSRASDFITGESIVIDGGVLGR